NLPARARRLQLPRVYGLLHTDPQPGAGGRAHTHGQRSELARGGDGGRDPGNGLPRLKVTTSAYGGAAWSTAVSCTRTTPTSATTSTAGGILEGVGMRTAPVLPGTAAPAPGRSTERPPLAQLVLP